MKKTLLLFLLAILSYTTKAAIDGPKEPCPNIEVEYSLYGFSGFCNAAWLITGGKIISYKNGNATVVVKWDDFNSSDSPNWKLSCRYSYYSSNSSQGCDGSGYDDIMPSVKAIRPIKGVVSSKDKVPCGYRNQITFTAYTNFSASDKSNPTHYYWKNPNGWTVVSQKDNYITYNVTNDNTLPISVYGTLNEGGNCSTQTSPYVKTITRDEPILSIVGPSIAMCGIPQQVVYTVSGSPSSIYTWTYPQEWTKLSESQSGNTITFNNNGKGGRLTIRSQTNCSLLSKDLDVVANNDHIYITDQGGGDWICDPSDGERVYAIDTDTGTGLSTIINTIWSTTGPLEITYADNNMVAFHPILDSGIGTLKAIITTTCGIKETTKQITIGIPEIPYTMEQIQGETLADLNAEYTYYLPQDYPAPANYSWEVIGGNPNFPPVLRVNNSSITITFNSIGNYTLKPILTGPCGPINMGNSNLGIKVVMDKTTPTYSSIPEQLIKTFDEESQMEQDPISYYPNPANSEILVRLSSKKPNKIAGVTLLDINGSVLSKIKYSTEESFVRIQTDTVPSGIYVMRVVDNLGIAYKRRVIIKR